MDKNGWLGKEQFQHFSLTGEKEKLFSSKKIYMHEDCCPKPLLKDGCTIHFRHLSIFWFWPQWTLRGPEEIWRYWVHPDSFRRIWQSPLWKWRRSSYSHHWHLKRHLRGMRGDEWWQTKPAAPAYVLRSDGDSLGTDVGRSCLVLQCRLKDRSLMLCLHCFLRSI